MWRRISFTKRCHPEHGNDTPAANLLVPTPVVDGGILSTPRPFANNAPHNYSTPRRPYALSPYHTLQRTSTIRRSNAPRRSVSDREAMKQLVDCVGMSAKKKVLESGRKPRVIGIWSLSGKSGMRGDGTGKGSYSSNVDHRNNQPRTYTYNYASSEGTNTDSEDRLGGPPSPSPRPRSAMSTMSII